MQKQLYLGRKKNDPLGKKYVGQWNMYKGEKYMKK